MKTAAASACPGSVRATVAVTCPMAVAGKSIADVAAAIGAWTGSAVRLNVPKAPAAWCPMAVVDSSIARVLTEKGVRKDCALPRIVPTTPRAVWSSLLVRR